LVDKQKSAKVAEIHQEKKKQSIMDDLDEMEKQVKERPVIEVDETLAEESGYVDPRDEDIDWIEQTRTRIAQEEPKKIAKDTNFGVFQETRNKIDRIKFYKSDFNVSEEYKKILVHKIKLKIEELEKFVEEIK